MSKEAESKRKICLHSPRARERLDSPQQITYHQFSSMALGLHGSSQQERSALEEGLWVRPTA